MFCYRISHRSWTTGILALLLVFIMPSVTPLTAQTEDWLPAPTGPYQVGTTFYYWVDEARDETFTDDPNDKRELVVRIWYPADVDQTASPVPYFPYGEADVRGFAASHGLDEIVGAAPVADFAQTPTQSYLDAPLSDAQPSYPVLIHVSPPFISTATNQDLASHGYIVVSAYLTHIWAWTVFPDGREVAAEMFTENWFESLDTMMEVAVQDQVFVLDQLEKLNASPTAERFSGRLALDQVGVFGSSWAAEVTMVASLRDSRFKATVAFVSHGSLPPEIAEKGLDLPIMFLDAEGEPSSNTIQKMRGPAYMLTLNGITSFSVGDFGIWPGMPQDFQDNWLGEVDSARAIQITNAYIRAFFDYYLMEKDTPLLDGPSPDYPEVEFVAHNIQG